MNVKIPTCFQMQKVKNTESYAFSKCLNDLSSLSMHVCILLKSVYIALNISGVIL